MNPTRMLRTLLAERLGQTAGRWPRQLFGEAEAPTLRQAIAERVVETQPPRRAADATARGNVVDLNAAGGGIFNRLSEADRRALSNAGSYTVALPGSRVLLSELPDVTADMAGNEARVAEYARRLRQSEAPAIVVARVEDGQWRILDGHTRTRAARRARRQDIEVLDATDLIARSQRGEGLPASNAPDGGSAQAGRDAGITQVSLSPEMAEQGIRSYQTPNIGVILEQPPGSSQAIVQWHPRVSRPQTLIERASLERDGIEAAMQAIQRDAAQNPGVAYTFQGDNPALIRRYTRLAEERAAAAGLTVRTEGSRMVLERVHPTRAQPNAGPPRPPPRPRPPSRSGGGEALATLAALPPGALTLRELLRDRYGTA